MRLSTSAHDDSNLAARQLLAANLRSARAHKGLSQEQLGDLSGLHRTYIGGLERAERNVTIDIVARLARALGYEVHELLSPTLLIR
nr:helix-turn-helix transcriptional regulator [Paraburkholderia flava]